MKIIHYCQHVLGIGHYFRSLEIARALNRHQLILVTGGPPVHTELPPHARECRLPGLQMDSNFSGIFPTESKRSLREVQEERQALLYTLFERTAPDLFMVELYPFGRKRFDFELLPVLEAIRRGEFGSTKVVCSLRDILVEKADVLAYESRVLKLLNRYFDALLVHADAKLVSLDETFDGTAEIKIPVVYTGFVTERPSVNAGKTLRERLGLKENEALVVASSGGGSVGVELLRAVLKAHTRLANERRLHLRIFTGPFMAEADFASLVELAAPAAGVKVERFTSEFLSYLGAADLSVSMAGYNTCMNILATGVTSLVWPFGQNREQRLRAKKLADLGALTMLEQKDLVTSRLAALMKRALDAKTHGAGTAVNLDGAVFTARWLEKWYDPVTGADS